MAPCCTELDSFMLLTKIRKLLVGIDAPRFRSSNASLCYTDRAGIRKKYVKLSIFEIRPSQKHLLEQQG